MRSPTDGDPGRSGAAQPYQPGSLADYETFVRDLQHLRVGRKSLLTLRSLRPGRGKYLATNCVARVAAEPRAGWDRLIVRSAVGLRYPGSYWVRIVEELPSLIPGAPYEDAYEALQRTWADRLDDDPGRPREARAASDRPRRPAGPPRGAAALGRARRRTGDR